MLKTYWKKFLDLMIPLPLSYCKGHGFNKGCGLPVWKMTVLALFVILVIIFGEDRTNDNKNKITQERHSDTSTGCK